MKDYPFYPLTTEKIRILGPDACDQGIRRFVAEFHPDQPDDVDVTDEHEDTAACPDRETLVVTACMSYGALKDLVWLAHASVWENPYTDGKILRPDWYDARVRAIAAEKPDIIRAVSDAPIIAGPFDIVIAGVYHFWRDVTETQLRLYAELCADLCEYGWGLYLKEISE